MYHTCNYRRRAPRSAHSCRCERPERRSTADCLGGGSSNIQRAGLCLGCGIGAEFYQTGQDRRFRGRRRQLREALQKSDKPERKQQAASWKVFRALEPGANGSVLYVFSIDPAVKDVDYTVSTILAETFPNEVQALYREYADAYATGQNVVNLKLVSALGQ
jgi:hypothetical protein